MVYYKRIFGENTNAERLYIIIKLRVIIFKLFLFYTSQVVESGHVNTF